MSTFVFFLNIYNEKIGQISFLEASNFILRGLIYVIVVYSSSKSNQRFQ